MLQADYASSRQELNEPLPMHIYLIEQEQKNREAISNSEKVELFAP